MEFANRSAQSAPTPHTPAPARPAGKKSRGKLLAIISVVLLVMAALLVAALIFSVAFSDKKVESDHVDSSGFQAVFLSGGQVYFGKIREFSRSYLTLDNIYYLRVNEQGQEGQTAEQQQDISLAKLGCELHGPEDKMVINREQVSFWENLKDDSQVVKAITEFIKQNPEGQECPDPTAQQQPTQ